MAIRNIFLLYQATGYIVTFVLSFCVVIPLSMNMHNFNRHCLLYTNGTFNLEDGNFIAKWASVGYCGYGLAVGVLVMFASFVQAVRMLLFLKEGTDSTFLSAFLDSVISLFCTVAALAASIIITGGFKTWCDAVTRRFPSCDEASVMEIDKLDGIVTTSFYIHMGTAQFGIWGCWVVWVFLSVLSTFKVCRYHERELIMVSMARERQRIVTDSIGPKYTEPKTINT